MQKCTLFKLSRTRISDLSEIVVKWPGAPWPLVPVEMRAERQQQRLTDVERDLAKPWFDWSTTLTSNVQGYIEWKATLPQTRRVRLTVGCWFGGVPQSMSIQRALTAFTSRALSYSSSSQVQYLYTTLNWKPPPLLNALLLLLLKYNTYTLC